jgi:membrane protein required for colicin V production
MNPFDMVVIVIVGFTIIRGIFRGLIKEVSSIVGVLGGFYAAYTYYPELAKPLSNFISNSAYNNIFSFILLFCVIFFIISILGVVIKYLLNIAFLGWVDRICGAGFGFIKGILICSVLLIALTTFLPKNAGLIKNSTLAPHVTNISQMMAKAVPDDMKRTYETKLRALQKTWQRNVNPK